MPQSARDAGPRLAKAQIVAGEIILRHLGAKPDCIERQTGGLSNLVFAVKRRKAEFIVRFNPSRAKLNPFLKEQWATARARASGVPAPEVLEVGNVPVPYVIQRKSAGQPATFHPDRLNILRRLGGLPLGSIRFRRGVLAIPSIGRETSFRQSSTGRSSCTPNCNSKTGLVI